VALNTVLRKEVRPYCERSLLVETRLISWLSLLYNLQTMGNHNGANCCNNRSDQTFCNNFFETLQIGLEFL